MSLQAIYGRDNMTNYYSITTNCPKKCENEEFLRENTLTPSQEPPLKTKHTQQHEPMDLL